MTGYGAQAEPELRASLHEVLADRCGAAVVLAATERAAATDADLWSVLARDMELAGLGVPAAYGGAGAGPRELAVVVQELGRAVAPVPYLGSAVVATTALSTCDTDGADGTAALLAALAAGTATAALAVPAAAGPAVPAATVTVASGHRLTGTVRSVVDACDATALLVPAGDALYQVDGAGPGVTRTPVVSLDQTRRLCDVELAGAPGRPLATGGRATAAVRAALRAGAVLLAAEQVGIAAWCLETTVSYVSGRYQFGRPVGSYQAVKHRLADVWVELVQSRAVARYAVDCLARDDPDTAVAASLAQAHCGPAAVAAAQACVQLHGGIGFTWEHPAHLYLKRAKADSILLGTADRHRAALAALVGLPG